MDANMNYGVKKWDPLRVIEGWTSENTEIDKFIKDTMYLTRLHEYQRYLE
ncbi:8172_t:CDS:2 [Funneliformis mosseae]|uniref:8172_t:CDS:1 n=1 Tax=Funneliformis mosseae TaxID=27381 RepID=A0A9N9CQH1_FUNMO|nr:8172_t:CDS:2 [Funneliformis mosseae]